MSGTVLGFDYGTKKIGIAVGQTITGTANPLTTLRYVKDKPDWAGIEKIIKQWQPTNLVVGLPIDTDDSETEISQRARRFARQLEGRFQLKVHMADERYTSASARSMAGKIKNIEELDALAAKLILETWLNE
jgi:putative Holliday junction resolvase